MRDVTMARWKRSGESTIAEVLIRNYRQTRDLHLRRVALLHERKRLLRRIRWHRRTTLTRKHARSAMQTYTNTGRRRRWRM
jgi:hypothetical protein